MRTLLQRAVALFAACALLAACVTAGAPPEPAMATLGPPVAAFNVSGRVAVRQGERSDHLRFTWRHSESGDTVSLQTPLGQGVAELVRDAGGARLVMPGRAPLAATDLRLLAETVFGQPLPLDALPDWLRGAHAELAGEQDGWQVTVPEAVEVAGHRLPRLLRATRHDIELRLVIDDWEATP